MGRQNDVIMMGVVTGDPIVKINGDKYVSASFNLLTARRSYRNDKGNLAGIVRSDIQQIKTRSGYMIENFVLDLEDGDLIILKGTLSTRDILRKMRCPYCGEAQTHLLGVMVYIDPMDIFKIRSVKEWSEEEINKELVKHAELSNNMSCYATLVREPIYAPNLGIAKRELGALCALNRLRYIVEDGPEKKTDYPYVRMFGKNAEDCAKVLHTGSEIHISGAIETRQIEMTKICPSCEENFVVESVAVEIVPYAVEFSENVDVTPLRRTDEDDIQESDMNEYDSFEKDIAPNNEKKHENDDSESENDENEDSYELEYSDDEYNDNDEYEDAENEYNGYSSDEDM